jgi:ribonuclease P protein component
MLSKKNKLNAEEIKNLFDKKEGFSFSLKIIRHDFFDIKIFSSTNKENNVRLPYDKFVVILSGKTFKKAVERNKIKRRIYSLLEAYLKDLNNKNNFYYVLIYPKKQAEDIIFQDLKKELYNILNNNLL